MKGCIYEGYEIINIYNDYKNAFDNANELINDNDKPFVMTYGNEEIIVEWSNCYEYVRIERHHIL